MTVSRIPRPSRLAAAVALAAIALPALAQDPPARAGRIAFLAGPVSFSPAGDSEWAQAPLNRPLTAGDRLWTDPGGRDEAQFGPVIARMDSSTLLSVLADDERATQLQVSQGRIDLHVRRVAPGEAVEVDTPNLAFVARAPGDYRIAVSPDGASTDVVVLRGAGDVYGDGNAYNLGAGQGYRFGGQDLGNLGQIPAQPFDEFDRWAQARDARLDRAQSARFVPADVVGYEDLDDNGAWRVVPDYGTVWVPTHVAQDWSPYHDGHWAWVEPWGWTWVDDQPWGYAVSHYGRWASIDNRWAWVPSPPRERPVYGPALVAFVGAALALGAAQGPGVGWFPLGPREPYRPSYQASPAYIARINESNTPIRQANVASFMRDPDHFHYMNRGVPGAMVAMPAAQFARAVPANRAAVALAPRQAQAAPLLAAPGARPLPESRIGMSPARQLPPQAAQQRVAVARALPTMHPGAAGMAGAAPLRMLRPAPSVRAGVPPPMHGAAPGAPQVAGRAGMPAGAPGRFGQAPGAPAQQAFGAVPGHAPNGAAGRQLQGGSPAPFVPGNQPAGNHVPGSHAAGQPGGLPLAPPSAPYPGRGPNAGEAQRRWAETHAVPGQLGAGGQPMTPAQAAHLGAPQDTRAGAAAGRAPATLPAGSRDAAERERELAGSRDAAERERGLAASRDAAAQHGAHAEAAPSAGHAPPPGAPSAAMRQEAGRGAAPEPHAPAAAASQAPAHAGAPEHHAPAPHVQAEARPQAPAHAAPEQHAMPEHAMPERGAAEHRPAAQAHAQPAPHPPAEHAAPEHAAPEHHAPPQARAEPPAPHAAEHAAEHAAQHAPEHAAEHPAPHPQPEQHAAPPAGHPQGGHPEQKEHEH